MNNTFNPIVTWREVDAELMRNGRRKYFPPVRSGKPTPAVILITGVGNNKKLAFAGQTSDVRKYFSSGSAIIKKIESIETDCGACRVLMALESDVMNGNQPLQAGFFNDEHVRKAIAEKINVEHLMDGYSIV